MVWVISQPDIGIINSVSKVKGNVIICFTRPATDTLQQWRSGKGTGTHQSVKSFQASFFRLFEEMWDGFVLGPAGCSVSPRLSPGTIGSVLFPLAIGSISMLATHCKPVLPYHGSRQDA
jgi:hypothetical protein